MHSTSKGSNGSMPIQLNLNEVSITVLCLLSNSANQELFKKYICNQSSHYENTDSATRPSYHLKLKYSLPFSVSYVYIAVRIKNGLKSTCIATMKNTDDFCYTKEAIMCNHQITLFTISKNEWNTKEVPENAFHVLWYAKRHLSGRSTVEQGKNQARSLSWYLWRHQAGRQLVTCSKKFCRKNF